MKIFFDVDTQNDFMLSTGKLYVPDAESIIGKIAVLTNYARNYNIKILGSIDSHYETDLEFNTFPQHCLFNTLGANKVISPMENEHYFYKNTYDVFSNNNIEDVLRILKVQEAVVYGVATDFCVKAAVLGLLKRGIQTQLVVDAIRGVFPDKTSKAMEEMQTAGAKFVVTKEIIKK